MLSCGEHENSFITSGPNLLAFHLSFLFCVASLYYFPFPFGVWGQDVDIEYQILIIAL